MARWNDWWQRRDAFDPERRCNPGMLVPTTRFCVEADPKARGYDAVPLS